ncbi:MAG: hypothetical protein IPL19_25145 [Sandaracinaceae bacterium]|nr:hypothetical protein [Sandaracinaceae bacterium]
MNRTMRVGLVAFALLGAACGDEANAPREEVARENTGNNAVLMDTTPEEAPLVAPTAESLPIPEDFEAEMAESVTPENYRAQLDAVMAELDAS